MAFLQLLLIGVIFLVVSGFAYNIPEPKVEIILPRGLRVSIPDSDGLMQFIFHGAVNRSLEGLQTGDFYGEIIHPTNGRWTFENMDIVLSPGDVLNFWSQIRHSNDIYRLVGRSITVPILRPVRIENIDNFRVSSTTSDNYDCTKVPSTRSPNRADHLKVTICLVTNTP